MSGELQPMKKPGALTIAGQLANQIAGQGIFEDYQARKAARTLARQQNDLVLFADYLESTGLQPGDFYGDPEAWRGVSWGLVAGFARWLLVEGYAVGSVNCYLSSVRVYAGLASKAGALDRGELLQIESVKAYSRRDAVHVDEKRQAAGIPSRRSRKRRPPTAANTLPRARKKAAPVELTEDQVNQLKQQPDTPQGRRDALLMALLLDHGLRAGEAALLTVESFSLAAGEFTFDRPKVNRRDVHKLTPDAARAARSYFAFDAPAEGIIWRRSKKDGALIAQGLSTRGITARVKRLGEYIGIHGLTAHDCRHSGATRLARKGTAVDRLMDWGGWASLTTAQRYIRRARIANEGAEL